MTATTRTVREIALEAPAAIRVFEQFGIDYCCGGRMPLSEACANKSIPVGDVLAAIERAVAGAEDHAIDFTAQPLSALAQYIVETHHAYVKREIPRLAELAVRVVNRHGDTRPELPKIQSTLAILSEELTRHLAKEEVVLFPYIVSLERAIAAGGPQPQGCLGTVENPIAMMTSEHDAAGSLMAEIRALSGDYTPPAGACPTFLNYYLSLREFEQDLHHHIHLENNILFPRAIELEASEPVPVR